MTDNKITMVIFLLVEKEAAESEFSQTNEPIINRGACCWHAAEFQKDRP